jgi:hypothetical protein
MKASKALQRGVWGWVFFLFIISCIAISTFTASAGRLGDINSDGEIDSTDVTLLKRHLLRKKHSYRNSLLQCRYRWGQGCNLHRFNLS